MTSNSILIQNLTIEGLSTLIRSIVREELATVNTKEVVTRFLSRQEVATLLKISLPTLNEYTHKGIIKGSRVGSRVLCDETQLKEALKDIPTIKCRRR